MWHLTYVSILFLLLQKWHHSAFAKINMCYGELDHRFRALGYNISSPTLH